MNNKKNLTIPYYIIWWLLVILLFYILFTVFYGSTTYNPNDGAPFLKPLDIDFNSLPQEDE